MTKITMTTTSIELDTETKHRIQRLAEAKERPADSMLREAVEQYVAREE
jgi:predicted transcriptional regulator